MRYVSMAAMPELGANCGAMSDNVKLSDMTRALLRAQFKHICLGLIAIAETQKAPLEVF